MTTELCAYSVEACETARRAGVTRVELCASPYEGGTTPSAAAIRMARRIGGLQLSVMVRPRGGDFLYSDTEFRQMLEEVRFARECGADGVVFGVLTPPRRAGRRILTSGGRNTAVEGIDTLRALVAQAAGRIELMAGSGVNPSNVRQLAATGVDAVHFSARSVRPGGMVFRNPHVSMGGCGDVSEYDLLCADERLIRQILTLLEP